MPRRALLSALERAILLAPPGTEDERIRHYSLSESDLSRIREKRGPHNRLGFAVQLCSLRHPGAVFFNRLGELRDRSFENQKHRASGLNLVAAIVLWNTVYLERVVQALTTRG